MAKLFLGLAIAVTLAAAVLGFLGKDKIDKLQGTLKETKQTLSRTEGSLRKSEGELKKTSDDLATANATIEKQTGDIAGLKSDKEGLTVKLAAAEMDRDKSASELASVKEELGKLTKGGDGNIEEMKRQFEDTKTALTKAQADLNEKTVMVDSLNKSKAETDEKLTAANKEVERYRANVTRNGLTGKVLAVNGGWNFVVLSVGDRQGAATGGSMIVTRDGEPIGRVRITSIEPSTSIADIVPGSVRRGVTVQPGDAVVYEGPRTKANSLASPAPGGSITVLPQQ